MDTAAQNNKKIYSKSDSNVFRSQSYVKVSEAAKILNISASTLRRFESEGKIFSKRLNNNYRVYNITEISKFKKQLDEIKNSKKKIRSEISYATQTSDLSSSPIIKPTKILKPTDTLPKIPKQIFENRYISAQPNTTFTNTLKAVGNLSRLSKYATICLILILVLAGLAENIRVGRNGFEILSYNTREREDTATTRPFVLATKDKITNFVYKINIPANFRRYVNIDETLQVGGLSTLLGGIVTEGADANLGTGTLTTGRVNMTGEASLNNLLVINDVTETTFEKYLDINGDVVGTGLNDVKVTALGGISLGDLSDDSNGNILMIDGGEWTSLPTTNITSLGTITTGVWQGTTIAPAYGGTGLTTIPAGSLIIGGTGNTMTTLPIGSANQILASNGSSPYWLSNADIVYAYGWGLAGNSGTNDSINFLGTTDNEGVTIRTNNIERLYVSPTGKVGIGGTNPQFALHIGDGSSSAAYITGQPESQYIEGDLEVSGTIYGTFVGPITTIGYQPNAVFYADATGTMSTDNTLFTFTETTATLNVNGSVNMDNLFIGGSLVTASAAEINILDGATISTTELNLLTGRTGTLIDTNNISNYAITSINAGSGLIGGTGPGATTIHIGAGSGLSISADSISIDTTTSGITSVSSSNSGLETTTEGLRLLGGCGANQVLSWDSTSQVWKCTSVSGIGGVTGTGTATQIAYWDSSTSITGNNNLWWDNANSRLGIGTSNPAYSLDVSGTINTQTLRTANLYLAGTQVTASASEINILDGALISTTELNLLSGRTGTLLDSNNVSSYAVTAVIAGSGLTGGTGPGSTTLHVGAGNGIIVSADDITIDADTTGTTSSKSNNSGLEVTTSGLRMLGGCAANEVLAWDAANQVWKCSTVSGIGSLTGTGTDNYLARWNGTNALETSAIYQSDTSYIGIGTTDPTARLDVSGTTWLRGLSANSGLYVNESGYVGIATTNPLYALDVNGNARIQTLGAGSGNEVVTQSSGVLQTRTIDPRVWTGGNLVSGTGVSGQISFFTGSTAISGSNNLWWDNANSRLGIGTSNPAYSLDVSGTINTQTLRTANLYLAGTQVTASASEINILDGALISTTELNLLSGRTGTLLDSNNVSSYAVTAVIAGSGLTGGTGPGSTTLHVGAGNGIIVSADDITIDADTTGTTSSKSNNSGLEVTTSGLRMLGGCAANEVLAWDAANQVWKCSTVSGIGSLTGTGTDNYLARWNGTNALETSAIYQSDTSYIGIGTTDPTARLDVSGTTWLRGLSANSGLYVNESGYVGIATTNPLYALDVNGNARIQTLGAGSGNEVVTQSSGVLQTRTIDPRVWTGGNLVSGTGVSGQVTFFTGSTAISGSNNLWWDNANSRLGIGTSNPAYSLDVSGTINTQTLRTANLYLAGTQVTASASEINILDGALISTTELNLLSGRTGTLLDSNNVSSYAVTAVIAGSGLTGGTGPGSTTLHVGAGNGIIVSADDITIDADTTGTTSSKSNNSGLEVTTSGLRMLGGCAANEVLAWDAANQVWKCSTVSGIGSLTGTGTDNYLARWNGTNALETSAIYQSDTSYIGIGTTDPTARLDVSGTTWLRGLSANSGLYVNESGYVGIATTNPLYALDVNGNARIQTLGAGSGNEVVTQSSGVLQTRTIDPRVWTGGNLVSGTGVSGQVTFFTGSTAISGSNNLWWDNANSRLGIGTSNPAYSLDVSGTINTQTLRTANLYLAGTQVTASASEINILDGALISTTELNLLSGRTGTLLDSNNVSSYAVTAVIAGSGLTGGTGPGSTTLHVGAGNGIIVSADDITIDADTTGTTSSKSNNSGLEVTTSGLRMLGGCAANEVLAWDAANQVWKCSTVSGIGSLTGTGTDNYLARWNGTNALETSAIYQSDTSYIGIGTTDPTARLDVSGTTWLRGLSANSGLYVNESGYVGIATTNPLYALDVNGNARIQTLGAGSGNEVVTQSSGVLQTRTIDPRVWTGGNLVSGTGVSGQVTFFTGSTAISGSNNLWWDNANSRLGIGTSNPAYSLDVSGTINTQTLRTANLYLAGTQVTASASEINILDGALISTTELNLLSGRTGTLLDSNNVSSYAVTAVIAGSGLTGGTGPGSTTLHVGAGNGIIVSADDITIDADTTGTTSSKSNNSGLEVTTSGLRMLGGCAANEVLAWDAANQVWKCSTVSGIGSLTGTGTDNYLARWNGTNALETSAIYQSDTSYIGIGTTDPTARLDVSGTTWLRGLSANSGLYVNESGYVGIATTNPLYALDVNGNARIQTLGAGSGNEVVTQSSGVLQTRTIDPRVWTGGNLVSGTGVSGQVTFFTGSTAISGSNNLWWDNANSRLGIGTSNPAYSLDVSGTINTQTLRTANLYLAGTQVTASASEINILDGALISTTELNLLSGRTGTLLDSNNVSSYAVTAVIAGSGLTGGTGPGSTTLHVGAGNGIIVSADDITIDADTTGTTSSKSNNSGLEVTTSGLRMLGGCAANEVLAWDAANQVWKCSTVSGIGSLTGTGTDNYLARWNGTNALETSAIYQSDTSYIGIGTTDPTARLDVSGTTWLRGLSANSGLYVNESGYVGIATTNPLYALDVNGNARIQTLGAGSGNEVVTQSSGVLQTRTIDPRVWTGGNLVSGTGVSGQVTFFTGSTAYQDQTIYGGIMQTQDLVLAHQILRIALMCLEQ
ncbi:MAG: hypothetical protein KatS3mg087_1497 [Patescibacteria group bacterium]|nr:MAG: hypothetical protein KatS3mg087_1497 [Patescibacteria group bacterium]